MRYDDNHDIKASWHRQTKKQQQEKKLKEFKTDVWEET